MLLRRITKHVKEQNWLAVGIDFFIVVVGVFIGIQVANWNDERGERALEVIYVERLHQEVMSLESVRTRMVKDRDELLEDLGEILPKVFDENNGALTDFECATLFGIFPTSNPSDDLPLITELLSSGRITIFSDDGLKQALSDFLTIRARARDSRAGVESLMPQVSLFHNHLYEVQSLGSTLAADHYRSESGEISEEEAFERSGLDIFCDIAAMRASTPFKNDLAQMRDLYSYHVDDNRRLTEALAALHRALDEIIDDDHEENAA